MIRSLNFAPSPGGADPQRARPALETLEGRDVPAGISLGSFLGSGSYLFIDGSPSDDTAQVWTSGEYVVATLQGAGVPGGFQFAIYPAGQVQGIFFLGQDGDDSFTNGTALASQPITRDTRRIAPSSVSRPSR